MSAKVIFFTLMLLRQMSTPPAFARDEAATRTRTPACVPPERYIRAFMIARLCVTRARTGEAGAIGYEERERRGRGECGAREWLIVAPVAGALWRNARYMDNTANPYDRYRQDAAATGEIFFFFRVRRREIERQHVKMPPYRRSVRVPVTMTVAAVRHHCALSLLSYVTLRFGASA